VDPLLWVRTAAPADAGRKPPAGRARAVTVAPRQRRLDPDEINSAADERTTNAHGLTSGQGALRATKLDHRGPQDASKAGPLIRTGLLTCKYALSG
jgi:hypothetical protein